MFLKTQFDKLLMAALFTGTCTASMFTAWIITGAEGDKLSAFFLQAAAGFMGALITLVTARRGVNPPPFGIEDEVTGKSTTTTTTSVETPKPSEPAEEVPREKG